MTREQAVEYLPLIEAFIKGKVIQYRSSSCLEWYDCKNDTSFWPGREYQYRIKPEPILRAWRPDEVPVGALLKDTSIGFYAISVIMSLRGAWVGFIDHETSKFTDVSCECLTAEKYRYSIDGGKTWQRCGVFE